MRVLLGKFFCNRIDSSSKISFSFFEVSLVDAAAAGVVPIATVVFVADDAVFGCGVGLDRKE